MGRNEGQQSGIEGLICCGMQRAGKVFGWHAVESIWGGQGRARATFLNLPPHAVLRETSWRASFRAAQLLAAFIHDREHGDNKMHIAIT